MRHSRQPIALYVFHLKAMALLLFGFFGFSQLGLAADAKQLFGTCAACHGKAGEGNAQLSAPNIAGMDAWYTETQLAAFASGRRGAHAKDQFGAQMRLASMPAIQSAANRTALAAYIAKMPKKPAKQTAPSGNLANGSTRYNALCSACHATNGQGNAALGAPAIAGRDSAYILRQINHFRSGIRGGVAGDKGGKQMAAISRMLAEKDIKDVVSHIGTLKP